MTPGVMHSPRLVHHFLGLLLPFTLLLAEDRHLECAVLKSDGSPAANASVFCYRAPSSLHGILAQPVFAEGSADRKDGFAPAFPQLTGSSSTAWLWL